MVTVGVIFNTVPLPADVPPHDTVYHCHVAPTPSVPPISVRVAEAPWQIVDEGLAVTEVGIADIELTVREVVKHPVVLHVPEALT